MTNEPYALRLADELTDTPFESTRWEAANELRRLHALNAQLTQVSEELLDALKKAQETVRFGQNLEKLDVLLKTAISHAESTLKTE